VQAGENEATVLGRFRIQKDALFARHPQSALNAEQRRGFAGLPYFPYSPQWRLEARLEPEPGEAPVNLTTSGPHPLPFRQAGRLHFTLGDQPLQLVVYWIDVYGGGLFLPFRDATCGDETYGGGRYLWDTVKGADFFLGKDGAAPTGSMGYSGGQVILDFNYAYNPSCAYDSRWVCPLAPPENRLAVPVRAGERRFRAVV
jgi:uncharacterized protein (DUF1684 family)